MSLINLAWPLEHPCSPSKPFGKRNQTLRKPWNTLILWWCFTDFPCFSHGFHASFPWNHPLWMSRSISWQAPRAFDLWGHESAPAGWNTSHGVGRLVSTKDWWFSRSMIIYQGVYVNNDECIVYKWMIMNVWKFRFQQHHIHTLHCLFLIS